jgi:pimeloyl-ACP methyl ester carboxylesterase
MPAIGRLNYLESRPSQSAAVRPRGVLVLLHAFPLNARMWEPQHALAEAGWRVIVPQFRGMDGGERVQPVTSIDDFAGDVIDLVDALHIEDAVFCGLSMGGYVAFAILRHAPRYIRALVLADTRSQADSPEGVAGRKKMLALMREKGAAAVAAVADDMLPKLLGETTRRERPDIAERVRRLILANSAEAIAGAVTAMMTREDSTPLLATIHCPTLIVVGDEDTLTLPSASDDMHRQIPGSALVVVRGAGHLSNIEQPEAFNVALTQFLEHKV